MARAHLVTVFAFHLACNAGVAGLGQGGGSASDEDARSRKDQAAGGLDDENQIADQPIQVAGAWLACGAAPDEPPASDAAAGYACGFFMPDGREAPAQPPITAVTVRYAGGQATRATLRPASADGIWQVAFGVPKERAASISAFVAVVEVGGRSIEGYARRLDDATPDDHDDGLGRAADGEVVGGGPDTAKPQCANGLLDNGTACEAVVALRQCPAFVAGNLDDIDYVSYGAVRGGYQCDAEAVARVLVGRPCAGPAECGADVDTAKVVGIYRVVTNDGMTAFVHAAEHADWTRNGWRAAGLAMRLARDPAPGLHPVSLVEAPAGGFAIVMGANAADGPRGLGGGVRWTVVTVLGYTVPPEI